MREKVGIYSPNNSAKGLHGEGLVGEVGGLAVSLGLEVGRLIVLRGVLSVGQLHEQVPLQQEWGIIAF